VPVQVISGGYEGVSRKTTDSNARADKAGSRLERIDLSDTERQRAGLKQKWLPGRAQTAGQNSSIIRFSIERCRKPRNNLSEVHRLPSQGKYGYR
jgi:hypothetical protein